jgi:hypothetical protein
MVVEQKAEAEAMTYFRLRHPRVYVIIHVILTDMITGTLLEVLLF